MFLYSKYVAPVTLVLLPCFGLEGLEGGREGGGGIVTADLLQATLLIAINQLGVLPEIS